MAGGVPYRGGGTMSPRFTLFFAPGSSSMAAHIGLHEVGADFESRPLSFERHEQREPTYLAINPEGKVPTLLIDDRPLTEVAGILFYLAKRFPAAGLLPEDGEAQARIVSWMSFIASTLHPARRRGVDYTNEVYAIADRRLGSRDWVEGRFSIADIHLFRLYWRFAFCKHPKMAKLPHLAAHHDRMLQRPAVQRTLTAETAIGYELYEWFPAA
jgi:glutathione S-transferase